MLVRSPRSLPSLAVLLALLFVVSSCSAGRRAGPPGIDSMGSDSGSAPPGGDFDAALPPDRRTDAGPFDAGRLDGTGVYDLGDGGEIASDLCPESSMVPTDCVGPVEEGSAGLCDGVDNDCDGDVDERCYCDPGAVQRCFRGPPGRRDVGACQDGMQTCVAASEFGGLWGPCEGGIAPSLEACDDLDNDCNGCDDEIADCVPSGSCPAPGDTRVPDGRPFSTYTLRGADFYSAGDAMAWRWEVTGTPCDQMYLAIPGSTATADNGQLSFTLRNGRMRDATIDFTLSGDYQVTLTVTRSDGTEFTCTWIVHVRAPGLRVEACWDATGPTASSFGGTVDVDLHLGKIGTTSTWFDSQDCDYSRCKATSFSGRVTWGYPTTPIANCSGPGARGGFTGACPNPRLDVDNISESSSYVPENINLDNPNDGDQFRVMVHHYTSTTRLTHPLVNVYCGGELRGTYGQTPDLVPSFDEGGGRNGGDMWRVVDARMMVDPASGAMDCTLTPIHPAGETSGYYVTTDSSTF